MTVADHSPFAMLNRGRPCWKWLMPPNWPRICRWLDEVCSW